MTDRDDSGTTPGRRPLRFRRGAGGRPWVVVVAVVGVLAVLGAAAAFAARQGGGTRAGAASPAPLSASPTAAPASTGEATASDGEATASAPAPSSTPAAGSSVAPAAAPGCPAGGGGIPAGAGVHQVVDVDGDGRPDQAWLVARAGSRRFGITTASGATFSAEIDDASPVAAAAVVNVVQPDRIPIALVDVTRDAHVYSLAGCAVTPVLNAQGRPYTFDRGYGDQGTGAGCTQQSGYLWLAGLDAVRASDGTYQVTRTFIDLDPGARHAKNGQPQVVATKAKAGSPVVVTAKEVTCGDLVAGRDGPVQPEG